MLKKLLLTIFLLATWGVGFLTFIMFGFACSDGSYPSQYCGLAWKLYGLCMIVLLGAFTIQQYKKK